MLKKEIQVYKDGKENPNAYVYRRRKRSFNININFKRLFYNPKYTFYFYAILVLMCIIGFLLFFNIVNYSELYVNVAGSNGVKPVDSNFVIYYLDVGQGDSSIIICDDEVMVVDTSTTNHENEIHNALYALDIEKIDYLLITHQHDDHMGNAEYVIKNYSVTNIVMPSIGDGYDVEYEDYINLLNTIGEYNVNPISASNINSFNLGSASIDILSPNKNYDKLNNMSIVFKITYGDTSFLFQGDAEKQVEKQLIDDGIDLSADVIKIGHHGSNTSSTQNYLSYVDPSICVISYGKNNYRHPNSNVIKRLDDEGVDVYLSYFHGNITMISDGQTITVYTQKNGETKIYK